MEKENYHVGIYCRLSRDDDRPGESMSIVPQRAMLLDYCREHGYFVYDIYIDDGFSGLNFERDDFRRLLADIEQEKINMVITKDLSRLGRDYIMTGYYTEIFFPSKGVRYIALSDGFDTEKEENDIAPFKNILNDMYARDISRKIKAAKRQRAKLGLYISSQPPYGYRVDQDNHNHLVVDPEAAQTVRLVFELALHDMGTITIAKELGKRKILKPAAYKYQRKDRRFSRYGCVEAEKLYDWCPATIGKILSDQVYLGHMVNHKSEVTNCKTKQRRSIPAEQRIVVRNRHEAIISPEVFERVQQLRAQRRCPAKASRNNLFRGLLYCSCCGHPLSIAHRKLTYREEDFYRCMRHFSHPEECPQTHAIYHEALCAYLINEIRTLAKSMKRRKVKSQISAYTEICDLTPEILHSVIERIEIGHVTHKCKLKNVVFVYWKLK